MKVRTLKLRVTVSEDAFATSHLASPPLRPHDDHASCVAAKHLAFENHFW